MFQLKVPFPFAWISPLYLICSEEGLVVNTGDNDRVHIQLFSQLLLVWCIEEQAVTYLKAKEPTIKGLSDHNEVKGSG